MLLLLTFWRTLVWLVASWCGDPYYSHGFVVPLISVFLAWRLCRSQTRGSVSGRSSYIVGSIALALCFGAHLVAMRRGVFLVDALTLVAAFAGLTLALGGWALLRRQAFPLAYLALAIPLPILERWTPGLAQWVAQSAAALAKPLGIPTLVQGARLILPSCELVVGAPCSGVNSLAALVTMGTLYAFLVPGPIAARVSLVLLTVPLALAVNLARVFLLLVLAAYAGAELALRYFHDWSGLLLFVLAVGLLFLVGRLLGCDGIRSDI